MRRVLVANRGEIAVRVIRACRRLSLEVVAVYSEADRDALHVRLADRAVCIGPARPQESYLNMNAILATALGTRCDAVHPGYGFLAENWAFAELCARQDLTFIGPSPEAIRLMGDKVEARRVAAKLGVPVVPGTDDALQSAAEGAAVAARLGFPVLVKAAAGGGGRGMRIVRTPNDFLAEFEHAAAEAGAAFGDRRLFVERYLEHVRHVEIQVLGDRHGARVHLGERDCSVQRRYQKLLEEAPSPAVTPALRKELADAALTIANHVGYEGAGTVEFVLDPRSGRFYFLEMNTRIQVEHPVTELVTGHDLVIAQLRIAAGERLDLRQDEVEIRGHAIECRINAEHPEAGFRPAPGRITAWRPPSGDDVRVDSHCYDGYLIPPFYDSLLAKVIVHGKGRDAAVTRMRQALGDLLIEGVPTTLPFHLRLLGDSSFLEARIHTRWVEEEFLPAWSCSSAIPTR